MCNEPFIWKASLKFSSVCVKGLIRYFRKVWLDSSKREPISDSATAPLPALFCFDAQAKAVDFHNNFQFTRNCLDKTSQLMFSCLVFNNPGIRWFMFHRIFFGSVSIPSLRCQKIRWRGLRTNDNTNFFWMVTHSLSIPNRRGISVCMSPIQRHALAPKAQFSASSSQLDILPIYWRDRRLGWPGWGWIHLPCVLAEKLLLT